MPGFLRPIALATLLAVPALAACGEGITFKDGLIHTIDASNRFPFEGVFVEDSLLGNPTTVNVAPGGEVGTVSSDGLQVSDTSVVNVTGGIIGRNLLSLDTSTVYISGGTLLGNLVASDETMVDLSGGVLKGDLLAFDDATITVHGSDFNLPLGNIVSTSGTLSGVLNDGTRIDVCFGRASTATITLVPEPSTALLPFSAFAVLAALAARERQGAVARSRTSD